MKKKLSFEISAPKPQQMFHKKGGKHVCRPRIVVLPGLSRPAQPDGASNVPVVPSVDHRSCDRDHMVVLPGYGEREYPFPTVAEVVTKACESIAARQQAAAAAMRRQARGKDDSNEQAADAEGSDALTRIVKRSHAHFGDMPSLSVHDKSKKALASQLPGSFPAPGAGPAAFVAAEGIRVFFYNGRFEAIVADKFDSLTGAVNWARNHMPEKYQAAIESLHGHLVKLKDIYREALPKIINFLEAQYPQASKDELLDAAVQVIDEQLAQILYVLSIWTKAFGQLRDGEYEELAAVIFTVEQAYHLNRTGDIDGHCDEECQKRLKTRVFGVEDVFVARFSGQGPATIPGSRGPVGAHAIEVPHDERDIITLMLVLYLHEFRHDLFYDIEGLPEEVTKVVVEAIDKAGKEGKLTFSSPTIRVGNQKVDTLKLVTKLYADTITEVDADIAGGVLLSGPAFLYNMLYTFAAFNAKENGVFNQNVLLRSGSVYEVDEKGALNFEVHMPDYVRVYVVAAALDLLGFKSHADECRRMADQLAGVPTPKDIYWVDAEGKRKMTIKIPVADIVQAAPAVAEALIRTPLAALGGVSMEKIVNWTARRQSKTDALVANLVAGKSDVPSDRGDYHATYVAAAATLAYFELVKAGVHPIHAARQVEPNALAMLDVVRKARQAKETASAGSKPEGGSDGETK